MRQKKLLIAAIAALTLGGGGTAFATATPQGGIIASDSPFYPEGPDICLSWECRLGSHYEACAAGPGGCDCYCHTDEIPVVPLGGM